MTFYKYLTNNWPPTIKAKMIKSPSGKRSNFWTQYLEYLIQNYCSKNRYYWLRELECGGPRKKLDYAIIKHDPMKTYFAEGTVDWNVLIEAEWDQGQYKKFKKGDFKKLVKCPVYHNGKHTKIVIINTSGGAKCWKDVHEKIIGELKSLANKDNAHYSVLMTCIYSVNKTKYIGWSVCDNWGELNYEELMVGNMYLRNG